jgi:hypothetical protein
MSTTPTFHDTEALQARLALRLAGGLSEQAASLPQDIGERLRVAREQAVARARHTRLAVPALALAGPARGLPEGPVPWWQRMAAVMPLLVLVVGLLAINQWTEREQVLAAAAIDTVLLADDLPPAAYTDPGFAEFLKTAQP